MAMPTAANDVTAGVSQISLGDTPLLWHDATTELLQATSELKLGQLVKDDSFSLYDSIGALEIMDAKMDSGLIPPNEGPDAFDVCKPMLPEEVVGLMDQLLAAEMSWHTATSLSQTVFTSLHVEHVLSQYSKNPHAGISLISFLRDEEAAPESSGSPEALMHYVFRPYVLALIKCVDHARERMLQGQLYEDEDVSTMTFGWSPLEYTQCEDVLTLLDAANKWLEEHSGYLTNKVAQALQSRIALRWAFLVALSTPSIAESITAFQLCLEHVEDASETRSSAKEVPKAFSMSVQRTLASQIPPRQMMLMSVDDGYAYLERMCSDMRGLMVISEYVSGTDLFNYFQAFAVRRPVASGYVRASLQIFFLQDLRILGKITLQQFMVDLITEFAGVHQHVSINAPEDASEQAVRAHQLVQDFLQKAAIPTVDLFRVFCHNRARLRRNMIKMLYEFDALQVEAEAIDAEILTLLNQQPLQTERGPSHPYPLSSWVYHNKLQLMETIILLGFELELYQPYEWSLMYWYLDYVLDVHRHHLERTKVHISAPKAAPKPSSKKSKKNKKPTPPPMHPSDASALAFVESLHLQTVSYGHLSRGCFRLTAALTKLGLISRPERSKLAESTWYNLRLKPFLRIGAPEFVPFDDFKSVTNVERVNATALLEVTQDYFAQAKKSIELFAKLPIDVKRTSLCESLHKASCSDLLRSCVANSVFLQVVRKMPTAIIASSGKIIKAEAKYHAWFQSLSLGDKPKKV
ncbi:N-alpha-acetyltransferase, non-catalitic subunit [Saitoella coloradoensis]